MDNITYTKFGDVQIGTEFRFDKRSSHIFVKTNNSCEIPEWRGGLAQYTKYHSDRTNEFPVGNDELIIVNKQKEEVYT